MPFRKNADGIQQYYYKKDESKQKIIQKDLFKGHGYKRDTFPPQFFENVEKTLKRGYWAYAIDGDGWIHIYTKNIRFEVGISLNDREPIQELADIYGASISRKDYKNKKKKSSYIVKIYGKRALHFLRLICPHMTEKRKKATQAINMFDPNYHPPKISMDFRQNPDLLKPHMESVGGFFDTEGSVGIKIRNQKKKTKKLGEKIYSFLDPWLKFDNTDIRPLRKLKKLLETWPFNFKTTLSTDKRRSKYIKSNGENIKTKYTLSIPQPQHLLFMKMFSPWILITRKREYADRFELKKKIYEICGAGK
jgi:hypothetical protein